MAESGGATKWLKYGCFGCLGVLGVLIVVAATMSGIALNMVRSEQIEDRELSPQLPTTPPSAERRDPPAALPGAGAVRLDLSHAAFYIEPGKPGQPLRVEARYDKAMYELEEVLESADDGSWSYRVVFRRTGSSLLATLKELFGGTGARVRVLLPPDVPLNLELRLREGETQAELGGLWLTDLDLDASQGGYQVDFSDPLKEPVERISLRGSMGGFMISELGNASPRALSVDMSMGGMQLDLRGEWVRDAEIDISSRMGGSVVRLPRGVLIEGLDRGGVSIAPEQEVKPPTLSFSVSAEMGELEFID
jgi:hypothetical protein